MEPYKTFEQAKEAFDALNEAEYTVTCLGDGYADILEDELECHGVEILSSETDPFGSVIFNVTGSILNVDSTIIENGNMMRFMLTFANLFTNN